MKLSLDEFIYIVDGTVPEDFLPSKIKIICGENEEEINKYYAKYIEVLDIVIKRVSLAQGLVYITKYIKYRGQLFAVNIIMGSEMSYEEVYEWSGSNLYPAEESVEIKYKIK